MASAVPAGSGRRPRQTRAPRHQSVESRDELLPKPRQPERAVSKEHTPARRPSIRVYATPSASSKSTQPLSVEAIADLNRLNENLGWDEYDSVQPRRNIRTRDDRFDRKRRERSNRLDEDHRRTQRHKKADGAEQHQAGLVDGRHTEQLFNRGNHFKDHGSRRFSRSEKPPQKIDSRERSFSRIREARDGHTAVDDRRSSIWQYKRLQRPSRAGENAAQDDPDDRSSVWDYLPRRTQRHDGDRRRRIVSGPLLEKGEHASAHYFGSRLGFRRVGNDDEAEQDRKRRLRRSMFAVDASGEALLNGYEQHRGVINAEERKSQRDLPVLNSAVCARNGTGPLHMA
ncbi:hypothetical protein MRB53_040544 [Persea americana]|nr:hypothetical protein MRB53_040544 [Persea americana]